MPSLLDNLDASDLVRQVNELNKMLLANVCRQLENSTFGLNGSRRNLSPYRNRLISNFVSVLNLRHLDVLVHLIVHCSDICGVRSLSLQDGERGLVLPMEESLLCISVNLIQG